MAPRLAATSERGKAIEDYARGGGGFRPIKIYVDQISTVPAEYDMNVMLIPIEIMWCVGERQMPVLP